MTENRTTTSEVLRGGEFIIRETAVGDTFIPEQFDDEQLAVKDSARTFVDTVLRPNHARIEKQEEGLVASYVEQAGELGLLGAHIPEEYGGMNLRTNTNTLICEELGAGGSFTVAFAAHTGIGMLPILYYGTEEQKQKYLPRLSMGELKACYCLTEPGSGSDALAAKSTAILNEAGTHYVLNGQKMWITNSGFADIFIVFAQVDGDKFTGFIVEKDSEGLTLGAEEDKLGIKGSSTRQVFFENVSVPKENVLGTIGKGHLIAFNVLNVGRFKLGALVLGGAKAAIGKCVEYANERHQFKQPIANFGAIKYKLAEQAIRTFALESSQYRVSNLIGEKIDVLKAEGATIAEAKLKAAEEYAAECAMLKVYGSETLDYVVDEFVQIYGGNGFSEEYPAACAYRDSRINRIYEGTNEINRLLSIDMVIKRAMKGQLDLVGPAWAVQKELASMPQPVEADGPFAEERAAINQFKKVILVVAGAAVKAQMDEKIDLRSEQEVIMNIADLALTTFNAESTLLRLEKLKEMGRDTAVVEAALKVLVHDAAFSMSKFATDALASFAGADELRIMLMGVKRFTKYTPQNVKVLRRQVADHILKTGTSDLV